MAHVHRAVHVCLVQVWHDERLGRVQGGAEEAGPAVAG